MPLTKPIPDRASPVIDVIRRDIPKPPVLPVRYMDVPCFVKHYDSSKDCEIFSQPDDKFDKWGARVRLYYFWPLGLHHLATRDEPYGPDDVQARDENGDLLTKEAMSSFFRWWVQQTDYQAATDAVWDEKNEEMAYMSTHVNIEIRAEDSQDEVVKKVVSALAYINDNISVEDVTGPKTKGRKYLAIKTDDDKFDEWADHNINATFYMCKGNGFKSMTALRSKSSKAAMDEVIKKISDDKDSANEYRSDRRRYNMPPISLVVVLDEIDIQDYVVKHQKALEKKQRETQEKYDKEERLRKYKKLKEEFEPAEVNNE